MPANFYRLYVALIVVSLLSALDVTIVATSLPVMIAEFNAMQNISWIIAAYSLANGIALPIYGRLVDRYGPKKMFIVALSLFLAASLLCGASVNVAMLSASRVLQGFGAAGLSLLPVAIISGLVPERFRAKYTAPLLSVWTVATLIGPLVGGILTETVGWRWVFFINIPIGMVAVLLAIPALPKKIESAPGKLFNLMTMILFALFATSLIFTLHSVADATAGDFSNAIYMILITLILLAIFIWRSLKVDNPIIPIRDFKNRGLITVLVIATLSGASLFPLTGYIPALLQMAFEVPTWLAGFSLAPMAVGILSASIYSSRRLSRTGDFTNFYRFGSAIAAITMFAIYIFICELGTAVIVAGIAITGVSMGFYTGLTYAITQAYAKSEQFGTVTSTVLVFKDISAAVVTTIAGGIFGFGVVSALAKLNLPAELTGVALEPSDLSGLSSTLRSQVEFAYVEAFRPIFLNSTLVYALVFLLALTLPKLTLKTQ